MPPDPLTPTPTPSALPQMDFPSQQDALQTPCLSSPAMPGERQTAPTLRSRVQRVLRDIEAARAVSDDELHTHIEDCRQLLEAAHDRFMASGQDATDSSDYAEAVGWMRLRDEALHMLSPEFKRARDLEVLRATEAEPGGTGCHFLDSADRDRKAMNEGATK